MALRIIWSAEARANLLEIRDYIGQFAPLAAQRFVVRLVDATESLAIHPDRGRVVERGLRELVAIRPYVIRYEVDDVAVRVLRIRHGARDVE